MAPRYQIKLTEKERHHLERLTKAKKISIRTYAFTRALLLCDAGGHRA